MKTQKRIGALLLMTLLSLQACSTYRSTTTPPAQRISPEEAYRLGKLKNKPYLIDGRLYVPMSFDQVYGYEETGLASWYGKETLDQHNGQPTAYGEIFDPDLPSAAHKYLPLPMIVRVTNLENNTSIIVRVNDRGPFVDGRVIDLSAAAAKALGFYGKGTARVKIESVYR
ncbi:MAG TPA: septal ring lytic transglycosylase RlpA family protein [Chlorobaculum sp.]|jgi:rare lipoprotein A|uniref:Probable endolytic peptidoglycan transglycosylase RlpA n=1 Tax=Chlorobaculum tepidum (strain ATCC 49652 / DSM 12025 / NBRC 103806 / TLS) TaxID=194439 RepID=Q8KA94_CHLTE|nr:septal ring lytic transglycosylase RlpA family protein [Chlorobaculum tepidum]AAM73487.1 rare lipoprotein A [Chlorobaculum tepidum TLS]HBU24244.1 septal ring lytic transglycosylase RlpA family protein [Chlorobaculum sp.]